MRVCDRAASWIYTYIQNIQRREASSSRISASRLPAPHAALHPPDPPSFCFLVSGLTYARVSGTWGWVVSSCLVHSRTPTNYRQREDGMQRVSSIKWEGEEVERDALHASTPGERLSGLLRIVHIIRMERYHPGEATRNSFLERHLIDFASLAPAMVTANVPSQHSTACSVTFSFSQPYKNRVQVIDQLMNEKEKKEREIIN